MKARRQGGFGLVEVLIASAIISSALAGAAATAQLAVKSIRNSAERTEARFRAEEAPEVARILRDAGYAENIEDRTDGEVHYPVFADATNTWLLQTTKPSGNIVPTLTFYNVLRESASDDITDAAGGSYIDTKTREVVARALWGEVRITAAAYDESDYDGDIALFPADDDGRGDPAQGFRIPGSDTVTVPSIEIFIRKESGTTPSDIYAEIRQGGPTGSVVGTTGTITDADIPSSALQWIELTFPTPIELSGGTGYTIRLRSDPTSTVDGSGSEGRIRWGFGFGDPSEYADGVAYRFIDNAQQTLDDYDFAFKINQDETGAKAIEIRTYLADIFGN